MRSKRTRTFAASAAVLMLLVTGCGTSTQVGNVSPTANQTGSASTLPVASYSGPIAATYTGGSLTKQELDQQYNLQIVLFGPSQKPTKDKFLSYYVVWYKYMLQKAQAADKTAPNATQARQIANQAIAQLASTDPNLKTPQAVEAKMKSLGLTVDDVARLVQNGQYLNQYLQNQMKSLTVSDAQAQSFYNANKQSFVQVTVDQILVKSLSQAQDIEKQLKAGAKFATLADKYSTDPSAKQNHGHLPNVPAATYVSEFAKAAETLPIGQISDPVHTQFGYHVLRVDSRTPMTLAQAKPTIDKQLLPQLQSQKQQDLYNAAVKATNVQVKMKTSQL